MSELEVMVAGLERMGVEVPAAVHSYLGRARGRQGAEDDAVCGCEGAVAADTAIGALLQALRRLHDSSASDHGGARAGRRWMQMRKEERAGARRG